jgi:hypothetical protein
MEQVYDVADFIDAPHGAAGDANDNGTATDHDEVGMANIVGCSRGQLDPKRPKRVASGTLAELFVGHGSSPDSPSVYHFSPGGQTGARQPFRRFTPGGNLLQW